MDELQASKIFRKSHYQMLLSAFCKMLFLREHDQEKAQKHLAQSRQHEEQAERLYRNGQTIIARFPYLQILKITLSVHFKQYD
jgi:hypothetical protein